MKAKKFQLQKGVFVGRPKDGWEQPEGRKATWEIASSLLAVGLEHRQDETWLRCHREEENIPSPMLL